MTNDDARDLFLNVFEASLEAQLRAVRRLRQGEPDATQPRRRTGLSQVDMAYDVLKKTRSPLHISELLERIQASFGVSVDRESLVSSLTKKVARQDRFLRPAKNTFALRPESRGRYWRLSWKSPPVGAACFLNRVPSTAPCGKLWDRWCAWAGAACRASSGPTAASIAVGARSIFCMRVASGSRKSCFDRSSNGPWLTAPDGWWA